MSVRKIVLSGGGTGGHIYPAVAVAEELRRRLGDDGVRILFVGALGQMEMEKVPALGYDIEGLPMAGLWRRFDLRNLLLPFKVARSVAMARRILREFGADAAVGFGGYASAPVLRAAQAMGIPTVVQEQNSVAGLTNRVVGRRARAVCVAYDGMERYFPAERIVRTGNPLRGNFSSPPSREDARRAMDLRTDMPVLLVVGGSLGCRTFNDMMMRHGADIAARGEMQVVWQTGKRYESETAAFMETLGGAGVGAGAGAAGAADTNDAAAGVIQRHTFIERMDLAYAAADLVMARSGAGTVSELALLGKPVLFVPSPSVAEDHQTRNAMALVERGAAEICTDADALERALPMAARLLSDSERLAHLGANIRTLGTPDAAQRIVDTILTQLDD